MEHANLKELQALDLDASDNLTEDLLLKFITIYGPQLRGTNNKNFIQKEMIRDMTV